MTEQEERKWKRLAEKRRKHAKDLLSKRHLSVKIRRFFTDKEYAFEALSTYLEETVAK